MIAVKTLNVPINHSSTRTAKLMAVAPAIRQALRASANVVVHCNKSFHRGPALLAAILQAGGRERERERNREKERERERKGKR